MKRLLILAMLVSPIAFADESVDDLKSSVELVCDSHPLKPQCEIIVKSMLVHAYAVGHTQSACEQGVNEACQARSHSKNFNNNVRWFEDTLKKP